jgi:hypothetical protein
MIIEPIGVLLILAGIYAMVAGLPVGMYLLCTSTLLGAAAALILPALGGANIQPAHFALLFLAVSVALRPITLAASFSSLRYPGPGFWFAVFVFYGVLTTLFFPRIFAGATIVYSLARSNDIHRILSTPLAPATTNLTQSVYVIGSFCCFAMVAGFCRLGGMAIMAKALIVSGAICVFFAVADLLTYATNTADLMAIIRNANYRMLHDGDIEGFKRIVGSFPEAGAFGYAALALFAFTLMLGLEGFQAPFLWTIVSALGIALLLCTSTTAYAATSITAVLVLAYCLSKAARNTATPRHLTYIAACLFALPLLVMTIMLIPSVADSLSNLINVTVTTKLESTSGEERMRWNAQAFTSFLDTGGLGAGIGSIRASSLIVALLANVGVPGTILFLVFLTSLIRSVLRKRGGDPVDRMVGLAGLVSCVAQVAAASISAGTVDLGPLFSITAGMAVAYALGPLHMTKRGAEAIAFARDGRAVGLTAVQGGSAARSRSLPLNEGAARHV